MRVHAIRIMDKPIGKLNATELLLTQVGGTLS